MHARAGNTTSAWHSPPCLTHISAGRCPPGRHTLLVSASICLDHQPSIITSRILGTPRHYSSSLPAVNICRITSNARQCATRAPLRRANPVARARPGCTASRDFYPSRHACSALPHRLPSHARSDYDSTVLRARTTRFQRHACLRRHPYRLLLATGNVATTFSMQTCHQLCV